MEEFQELQARALLLLTMRCELIEDARHLLLGRRVRCHATISEVEGIVEMIDASGGITVVYSYIPSGRSYRFFFPVEEISYRLTLVEDE